jgi:hypothetical protein
VASLRDKTLLSPRSRSNLQSDAELASAMEVRRNALNVPHNSPCEADHEVVLQLVRLSQRPYQLQLHRLVEGRHVVYGRARNNACKPQVRTCVHESALSRARAKLELELELAFDLRVRTTKQHRLCI